MAVAAVLPYITAAATIAGFVSSQQQASAQKKSIAAQQKIADAQAARERIQAAREARIRRAQILATTGNQGIGAASSGPAGAISSIGSQLGANIANINTIQNFADKASRANQQAVDAQAMGAMFQTVGNISGSFIKPKAPAGWQNIFTPKVTIGGG